MHTATYTCTYGTVPLLTALRKKCNQPHRQDSCAVHASFARNIVCFTTKKEILTFQVTATDFFPSFSSASVLMWFLSILHEPQHWTMATCTPGIKSKWFWGGERLMDTEALYSTRAIPPQRGCQLSRQCTCVNFLLKPRTSKGYFWRNHIAAFCNTSAFTQLER